MLHSGSDEEPVVRKPFPSRIKDDTILKQTKQKIMFLELKGTIRLNSRFNTLVINKKAGIGIVHSLSCHVEC